jgi:hypothetical protein
VSTIADKEAELKAAQEVLAAFDPTPGGNSRTKRHAQRVDSRIKRLARLAETAQRLERELAGMLRAEEQPARPAFVASPDTIAVGDIITTRYEGWRRVVRVNRKSVTVETGYSWTDTVPYPKVTGHRRATTDATAEGNA